MLSLFCVILIWHTLLIVAHGGSVGRGGSVVRFGAIRPESLRFGSQSSRSVKDFGQVLHSQLPAALRRVNSDIVSML